MTPDISLFFHQVSTIEKGDVSSSELLICDSCWENNEISTCPECKKSFHIDQMLNYDIQGDFDLYCLLCIVKLEKLNNSLHK
jgi:hypothetical protein